MTRGPTGIRSDSLNSDVDTLRLNSEEHDREKDKEFDGTTDPPLSEAGGENRSRALTRSAWMTRMYEAVFHDSPVGIAIWHARESGVNPTLRLLKANPAASRLLGFRLDTEVGRSIEEIFPSIAPKHLAQILQTLASGETNELGELSYRDARLAERWWFVRSFAVGDRCVGVIFEEISHRVRSHQFVAAEHAVTRVLAESHDLLHAAPALLTAICENLHWDVGGLWIVDRPANVLRCVDIWHAPTLSIPEFEEASRQLTFGPGVGMPGRVWATAQPAWITDIALDDNFPRTPVALGDGLHSAAGFPIISEGEVLGVVECFNRYVQAIDSELLDTMARIGSQISQFIERRKAEGVLQARHHEFSLARQIQQSQFPKAIPDFGGFTIAGRSESTQETGGDYWDVFRLADGRLAVAIGDASGHGIGAALIIAETRACLRTLALSHSDPGQLVALTNQRLSEDIRTDHFVTLLLAVIDPKRRSLVYTSAGHCPGFILNQNGETRVLNSIGLPLGVERKAQFPTSPAVTVVPGDLLFLFTDGLVESRSPKNTAFGVKRALDVVGPRRDKIPHDIVQELFGNLADFCGTQPPHDDCTAVVLKCTGGV